ncbi:MAG TPA: DUF2652 domain-containing protein, partial [Chitinophagaceae bacterium]|nr:DUF2652 domain-containing protein [Chitinophagaceae bacterium]
DIDQHEYWLVTKNLVPGSTPAGFAEWMEWNRSSRKTEGGEVSFHYTQLGELKKEIPAATMGDAGLPEKQKVLSLSREYDTDIISLFHASGDFRFRHKWQEGIKSVEEVSHFLPRVGMRCRCIMENGEAVIYASSYSYSEERISFSETDEKTNHTTTYLLEKLGPRRTRLQLDYYRSGNWVSNLFFNKQKKKKSLQQSLLNLDQAVKELEEPALN